MFGPVVIVGIGYPSEEEVRNRTFDMTPPSTDPATLPSIPEGWGPVGGAAQFLRFLEEDVRPSVEKMVPIDTKRQALFGHSLGGLFVLYVLFTHPDSFDTYIAGSPSIWWGNRVILTELTRFKGQLKRSTAEHTLLITVGGLEDRINPEELRLIQRINPERANVIGNAKAVATELRSLSGTGLQVEYVVFPDETHNSAIPAYLSRGARVTLTRWFK
jgi:predicted alpha/beta superfamily hydrolase